MTDFETALLKSLKSIEDDIHTIVTNGKGSSDDEAMSLRKKELAMREKELGMREKELTVREKEISAK